MGSNESEIDVDARLDAKISSLKGVVKKAQKVMMVATVFAVFIGFWIGVNPLFWIAIMVSAICIGLSLLSFMRLTTLKSIRGASSVE
jgi:ABC-type Na+ efflux pump permease subunit